MSNYIFTDSEPYLRDKHRFQRTRRELGFLPFYKNLSEGADEWLKQIKHGLGSTAQAYALDPGLIFWLNQLKQYMEVYRFRFSKEDHVKFIQLMYAIILEPDYDHKIIHKAFDLITTLIDDEYITRKDVTLAWEPLYELRLEVNKGNNEKHIDENLLDDAIINMKELFPLSATRGILAKIRPFINLWDDDSMLMFVNLFATFVPLKMTPREHEEYGAALWFDELWHFYDFVEMNGSAWESKIQRVFSAISDYCPGYIDWTPKLTIIFSKLMRSLNLVVRKGKVAVGDGAGVDSEKSGAEWIVWMFGGENKSAQEHLERLMRGVETSLHPLHDGAHTLSLQAFITSLVAEMVRRVRIERYRRKTRHKVPRRMQLTDDQIEQFVSTVLPSVLYTIFSTLDTVAPKLIMRCLAFLAPNIVLPKVLDMVYPSLKTTAEPNRLEQALPCLVEICVPLVRDDGTHHYSKFNVCKCDWIKKMSPHDLPLILPRSNKSSMKSADEPRKTSDGQERLPLREHAVILLEILIDAVDINDTNKLSLAFEAIESFFTLIPVVDCSAALKMSQYADMSEEEKRICELTGRFPVIVNKFISQVFKLVTEFATCAPKDSISVLDSISDVSDDFNGGREEILVDTHVQSAFAALLANSSSDIAEQVGGQIFELVKHSQFENAFAADMVCSLVQETVYANPSKYFPLFLGLVVENIKQCVTDETKKLRVLDPSTMWYIYLSTTVFVVPPEMILQNQEQCVEIHRKIISMRCFNAYQGACWSLRNVLTKLTEVYPETDSEWRDELNLPLEESLPIRKWGAVVSKDKVRIRWHTPTRKEVDFAEYLINSFVLPELNALSSPERMDKYDLKRSLFIVEQLLSCVGRRIPEFDTARIKIHDSEFNFRAYPLSAVPRDMRMFSFNGENIREKVRQTMHDLTGYLLNLKDDQSKNLERVASILSFLSSRGSSSQYREKRESVSLNFHDPIKCHRAELYRKFVQRVFRYQKDIRPKSFKFTESHVLIMKDLVLLGVHHFTDVRIAAQDALNAIIAKFPRSKPLIVKDVVEYLDPSRDSSHEELKGAVYMLMEGGFVNSSNMEVRYRSWTALSKIKYSEKPSLIELVDCASSMAACENWSIMKKITSDNLRDLCRDLFILDTVNDQLADQFNREERMPILKGTNAAYEIKKAIAERWTTVLRNELVALCRNKGQIHHWRNVDTARIFLFTLSCHHFDVESMKVFLQLLGNELWRERAAHCLSIWLQYNKPKSIREAWIPPKKVEDSSCRYACGLREDNLCIAYDSQSLPKDETSWDSTKFVSKCCWGAYQWPDEIQVLAPSYKQTELLRSFGQLNEIEQALIKGLRDEGIFQQWHALMINDEDEQATYRFRECNFLKYLFRNFTTTFLPLIKPVLEVIMKSTKKAEMRLAAVYCAGLIRGSRNWPFKALDEMWKWLKPLVVFQFEGMTSDAAKYWRHAIGYFLKSVDLRRIYWLVEALFESASKPAATAWQTCRRLETVRWFAVNSGWRSTELTNRVLTTAQSYLGTVALSNERNEIATMLAYPAVFGFVQKEWKNVPARFILPKLEEVIALFESETTAVMESAKALGSPLSVRSTKSCQADFATCVRSEATISSKRLVTLKILLELLATYYDATFVGLSPVIVSLFPLILHLANEETADNEEYGEEIGFDLASGASEVLFQIWSGIYLREDVADFMIDTVRKVMAESESWRARTSIMKFLQVFVYSNIFVCEKGERPLIIRKMVNKAIADSHLEVRKEAAECLTSFIRCGHHPADQDEIDKILKVLKSASERRRHGAILKLSSFIRAFPFSVPPFLIKAIFDFCKYASSKDSAIRATVTETLQSFLTTHHDKIEEYSEDQVMGPLITTVRDVMAPYYYA